MKLFRLLSFVISLTITTLVFSGANADDGSLPAGTSVSQAEIINLSEASPAATNNNIKPVKVVNSKAGNAKATNPDLLAMRRSLRSLLPNETIGVEMVNHTVALTGTVSSAEAASRAVKIADEFVNNGSGNREILNLMQLRSGQQVMLKVRVGEMKRSEIQKFGLGLNKVLAGGDGAFGILEGNGAFKTLAEPTLTAISGESAKFLAGGEFPVPIAQGNGAVSVDYKKFGVSVDFTPTVISDKRIRLNVASEVSELSKVGAVKSKGMKIPGISTRRANTTIELAPGESFMIAGLLKNNTTADLSEVPGLGDIPILNLLFRSAAFKRNETELVIAVTPYMADPVEAKDIKLPTEAYVEPSMMEMFMLGKLQGRPVATTPGGRKSGLEGPSGYTID